MNHLEILEVILLEEYNGVFETQEGFHLEGASEIGLGTALGERTVFPVEGVFFEFDRAIAAIDIKKSNGSELGMLLLCKGRSFTSFSDLSEAEFLAYLVEVPRDEFGVLPYVFLKDYLLVSDDGGEDYAEKYMKTAPIWGRYSHFSPPSVQPKQVTELFAIDGMVLPSQHHLEAFSRYIHSRNPLERYLRLYHCIELLFDSIVVLKIKKLGDDIRDFSSIMSEHGRGEIDRLRAIAFGFTTDCNRLAECLVAVCNFEGVAEKVFQSFSKEGNPISPKDSSARWDALFVELRAGSYSKAAWDKKILGKDTYEQFVCKIVSYWIYRVRCSIAHSRVGEFILEDSDHQFVSDFAEPLLLEFARQVFTAQALKDLMR